MAITVTQTGGFGTGSEQLQRSASAAGDQMAVVTKSIPAGVAGTLTTRTDDNTGTITASAAHGLSASDVVDVFWATGRRAGMVVQAGGLTSTEATLDGGSGDVLPSAATALVVSKPVAVPAIVDKDTLQALIIIANARGYFRTNSVATPDDAWGRPANSPLEWLYSPDHKAPPLAADIASLHVSNGTAALMTLNVRALVTG